MPWRHPASSKDCPETSQLWNMLRRTAKYSENGAIVISMEIIVNTQRRPLSSALKTSKYCVKITYPKFCLMPYQTLHHIHIERLPETGVRLGIGEGLSLISVCEPSGNPGVSTWRTSWGREGRHNGGKYQILAQMVEQEKFQALQWR